ncbi:MAG: hypothetical protein GX130_08605 [Candidatus Hydrogenedens sp.]|jgi:CRISPR-associated protein Csx10|nr:hypothetical protein [Candidatus Hydrogenedens sp.]
MQKRTLQITFHSDWQIGSGAGIPGSVDRQVVRDVDGLPYVPAKTLTGILRDAAEWLVENGSMDQHHQETNQQHQEILFGRQIPDHGGCKKKTTQKAHLSVRPARISEADRRKTLNTPQDKNALFIVQPHVKIEPNTGRAKDDHLFSIEQVRSTVVLEADVFLDSTGDDKELREFLDKTLKAVRRIGGKRRRGAGRCTLAWKSGEDWKAIDNESFNFSVEDSEPTTGWFRIPLTLEALEMLQIHKETLGNTVETRDFIPGYLILPYIAKVSRSDLRNAIAKGSLQISDFLPEIDESSVLPIPQVFFQPKGDENTIINRLITPPSDKTQQLKGLRSGYFYIAKQDETSSTIRISTESALTLRMHNTVQDKTQRPDEDVGGVFSYGAIQRGTKFQGEIRCTAEVYEILKNKSFSEEFRLGTSKKDDYGRVRISGGKAEVFQYSDIATKDAKTLVVYLESDVLVRDRFLSYSANPNDLKTELEKLLIQHECQANLVFRDKHLINAIGRGRRHEGWQTKWNLPKPSLPAIQAGSVYVFESDKEIDKKILKKIAIAGVGQRRAEGFGRVQFNPPWLFSAEITVSQQKEDDS